MQSLTILGSTGSIGTQTLTVLDSLPGQFRVHGLAAGGNWQLLKRQIAKWKPKWVAVADESIAVKIARSFDGQIYCGEAGLLALARQKVDLTISAISGVAGLPPTLAALSAGNPVALANKESLVLAGSLVCTAARKSGVSIYPIDSEHAALAQLIRGIDQSEIERVILTASGGALRDWPLERLPRARPEQVLHHPNWSMGAKVTLDSATLANKAFEVIEAHYLFGLPYEKITAVLHPQSLVHALVELSDGSLLASLAEPDMQLPILQALRSAQQSKAKLSRSPRLIKKLDLTKTTLEFRPIESKRYPLFAVILAAAKRGGLAPVVVAAAAETAGQDFLSGRIRFDQITTAVQTALRSTPTGSATLSRIQRVMKSLLTKS